MGEQGQLGTGEAAPGNFPEGKAVLGARWQKGQTRVADLEMEKGTSDVPRPLV
jgi:hypothetical protein